MTFATWFLAAVTMVLVAATVLLAAVIAEEKQGHEKSAPTQVVATHGPVLGLGPAPLP